MSGWGVLVYFYDFLRLPITPAVSRRLPLSTTRLKFTPQPPSPRQQAVESKLARVFVALRYMWYYM